MALSWDVFRVGKKYCSTACGRGCTWDEYQSAKRRANRLAKRLRAKVGGHWVVRVHENLGWHYRAANETKHIEVTENRRCYTAWLQVNGPWGGNLFMDDTTPERAVERLHKEAKKQLDLVMPVYELLRING